MYVPRNHASPTSPTSSPGLNRRPLENTPTPANTIDGIASSRIGGLIMPRKCTAGSIWLSAAVGCPGLIRRYVIGLMSTSQSHGYDAIPFGPCGLV